MLDLVPGEVAVRAHDHHADRDGRFRWIEASSAVMSPDTGLIVTLEHGSLDVIDPLVRQLWTLGRPDRVKFESPAISANGRRVLAQCKNGLLVWSIEVPASPEATVAWLDAIRCGVPGPH